MKQLVVSLFLLILHMPVYGMEVQETTWHDVMNGLRGKKNLDRYLLKDIIYKAFPLTDEQKSELCALGGINFLQSIHGDGHTIKSIAVHPTQQEIVFLTQDMHKSHLLFYDRHDSGYALYREIEHNDDLQTIAFVGLNYLVASGYEMQHVLTKNADNCWDRVDHAQISNKEPFKTDITYDFYPDSVPSALWAQDRNQELIHTYYNIAQFAANNAILVNVSPSRAMVGFEYPNWNAYIYDTSQVHATQGLVKKSDSDLYLRMLLSKIVSNNLVHEESELMATLSAAEQKTIKYLIAKRLQGQSDSVD